MRKLSIVLFIIVLIACQKEFDQEPVLMNALTDETILLRGNLVEVDKRTFRLDYYDVLEPDSHYKLLELKGYHGGGPSWLGIIYGAIKLSNSELLEKVRFDDEADGLAIWSSDKDILKQIGRLISVVKEDEELMNKCILVAEANWQME